MRRKTSKSKYVSEKRAAEYIGISVKTLQRKRREEKGPAYIQIGRLFKYTKPDIDAWMQKAKVSRND